VKRCRVETAASRIGSATTLLRDGVVATAVDAMPLARSASGPCCGRRRFRSPHRRGVSGRGVERHMAMASSPVLRMKLFVTLELVTAVEVDAVGDHVGTIVFVT